jgi:hypothetical protein
MNSVPEIQVSGFEVATVSATDEARARRDNLLSLARKGTSIKTADGAQRATDVFKELEAFVDHITEVHKEAKAPILKATREIDALKKELLDDVAAEKDRLSRLIGTWNSEQERLAAVERRKAAEREQKLIDDANAEAERKRKEAADAQAAIDNKAVDDAAEAKRKADERQAALDAAALRTRSDNGAARVAEEKRKADEEAAAEQERIRVDAEKARADLEAKNAAASDAHVQKVESAIVENRVAAAGVVATKTEGVSTRKNYEFEVTSLTTLYESNPLLVTLAPNKAAIKNALKMLDEGQHIPGVRHWVAFKAS